MTSTALVLVGRDRYGDPWHDHAACAIAVAEVLEGCGARPVVRSTFPATFEEPVARDAGLLVVLGGRGTAGTTGTADDDAWVPFHDALAARVREGVPLLALHASAMAFADAPAWREVLGGRWVEGTSWHPPIGDLTVEAVDHDHPVTAGLGPVTAFDELYCDLEVDPAVRVLVAGSHEGVARPVVWQGPGPGRVIYDALGHDLRSYESPGRRELLAREVRWLVGADPDAPAAS